jgi:carbon-monoxide dehydrogenase medium subunit
MAPGLLVLEAQVRVVGPNGSRTLPLEEFFVGPEQVDLRDGEILAEVTVPHFPQTRKAIYLKHGPRKAMDTAVVGVAVAVELDASAAKCETARVGLGAVAPTPVRGREAEALMEGKTVSEISLSDVGNAIKSHIAPISDVRGSADYRLEIAANLTIRAVQSLLHLPLQR